MEPLFEINKIAWIAADGIANGPNVFAAIRIGRKNDASRILV
jgi:hypothetical protein